jgi:L-asparaginase
MKIRFLTTGGTIDKVYFDAKSQYEIGESLVAEILQDSHVSIDFVVESVLRKDSLDMNDEDRRLVREAVLRSPERSIVVTHGTDTMVETAKSLRGIPDKVIALTGSLSPARFKSSDAIFNIAVAVAAAQTMPPGVYIAMNGRVFDPDRVRKNREKNRFEDATGAGESAGT